jgi:hypothetical protein
MNLQTRYKIEYDNGHAPEFSASLQSAKMLATKTVRTIPTDVTATISFRMLDGTYRVLVVKPAGETWKKI